MSESRLASSLMGVIGFHPTMVAFGAIRSLSAAPSPWLIITAEIRIRRRTPPIVKGGLFWVLAIITAMAPAIWAFSTLVDEIAVAAIDQRDLVVHRVLGALAAVGGGSSSVVDENHLTGDARRRRRWPELRTSSSVGSVNRRVDDDLEGRVRAAEQKHLHARLAAVPRRREVGVVLNPAPS